MALLMNTRGLVELIVLNLGVDLGILSPKLFAMMVVMAVVTTAFTPPLVHCTVAGHEQESEPTEAELAPMANNKGHDVSTSNVSASDEDIRVAANLVTTLGEISQLPSIPICPLPGNHYHLCTSILPYYHN